MSKLKHRRHRATKRDANTLHVDFETFVGDMHVGDMHVGLCTPRWPPSRYRVVKRNDPPTVTVQLGDMFHGEAIASIPSEPDYVRTEARIILRDYMTRIAALKLAGAYGKKDDTR